MGPDKNTNFLANFSAWARMHNREREASVEPIVKSIMSASKSLTRAIGGTGKAKVLIGILLEFQRDASYNPVSTL